MFRQPATLLRIGHAIQQASPSKSPRFSEHPSRADIRINTHTASAPMAEAALLNARGVGTGDAAPHTPSAPLFCRGRAGAKSNSGTCGRELAGGCERAIGDVPSKAGVAWYARPFLMLSAPAFVGVSSWCTVPSQQLTREPCPTHTAGRLRESSRCARRGMCEAYWGFLRRRLSKALQHSGVESAGCWAFHVLVCAGSSLRHRRCFAPDHAVAICFKPLP